MRKDLKSLENYQRCAGNWNQSGFLRGEDYPVAMAYVPWQHFTKMYENLEKGYQAGTIFPELDKPFTGRRCVK